MQPSTGPPPPALSAASSSLSSAPSNVSAHHEMLQRVGARLQSYHPVDNHDTTVRMLRAFLEELPSDGQKNISDDILQSDSDETLKMLADNLFSAVLVPSESLFMLNFAP